MVITSRVGYGRAQPDLVRRRRGLHRGSASTHILTGYDHLLFLLCLVIPLRGWRQVLPVITVFTVAHSFTLLGSAFDLAPSGTWFPPFVETAIAASIVYMALENIMGVDLERRVLITGLFGLVHGFGFSYGLQENLQFAGTASARVAVRVQRRHRDRPDTRPAVMLPLLALLRRYVLRGRVGMIILSALIAHTGWHWMTDRAAVLWKHAVAATERGRPRDSGLLDRRHPACSGRHRRHREAPAAPHRFSAAVAGAGISGLAPVHAMNRLS